jgi:hypothetical protein
MGRAHAHVTTYRGRKRLDAPAGRGQLRARGDLQRLAGRGTAKLHAGSGKVRGGTQSDSVERRMLYVSLLLGCLRRALRARSALLPENLALRQQLALCQRLGARPRRAGDARSLRYSDNLVATRVIECERGWAQLRLAVADGVIQG